MNHQLPQWQANLRTEAQRYAQLRAASPALLPTIGYAVLEFILRFLSGLPAGLLAGYASHLALDSLTPSSLPILLGGNMAIDQIELGRRIRQARESCGMTQDEVAEKLGVSRPIVVQIEQGKRPVSGIELQTLAYLFA